MHLYDQRPLNLAVFVDRQLPVAVRKRDHLRVGIHGEMDKAPSIDAACHVHRDVVRLVRIIEGTFEGVVVVGRNDQLAALRQAQLLQATRELGEEPVHHRGLCVPR